MRSIAQSVLSGSYDAGFIDEQAWDTFAERDEREGEPTRDQLRVIGKTLAVPDRLVLCSPKLSKGDRDKVRDFLFAAVQDHPDVLRPLRIAGYQQPSAELLSTCRSLFQPQSSEGAGAE
jgi:ABC-type phosphate/phosphonate transport system substrate-binding protein